jgi:hypothetical protein
LKVSAVKLSKAEALRAAKLSKATANRYEKLAGPPLEAAQAAARDAEDWYFAKTRSEGAVPKQSLQ